MTTAIMFLALSVIFGSFIIADSLWKVAKEIKRANNLKYYIEKEPYYDE